MTSLALAHPSGFLALSPRNERFTTALGFVAYRDHGRHRFVLGGVHVDPAGQAPRHSLGAATSPRSARLADQPEELLRQFVALTEAEGRNVVAVQVRESQLGLFRDAGFRVNQLGTSFSLDLERFSLAGGARMKLRQKIKRAKNLALRVREIDGDLERLHDISKLWLGRRRELDFLVGELRLEERRVFVVESPTGEWLGFITYVPAPGGWLHDLTRRIPEAPPGVMELCNSVAIERFRNEGARWLHFGFTPFVVDEQEPAGGNRVLAWLIRKLYRWGAALYPARSQLAYKLKWAPDLIEREYVAARPLSARAVFDFLRLTRSL